MFSHLILWGDKKIPADGTFLYCQLQADLITTTWRPVPQPVNGSLLYCTQDINQFDRTP